MDTEEKNKEKLNVRIGKELRYRLKSHCAEIEEPMYRVVQEILTIYLDEVKVLDDIYKTRYPEFKLPIRIHNWLMDHIYLTTVESIKLITTLSLLEEVEKENIWDELDILKQNEDMQKGCVKEKLIKLFNKRNICIGTSINSKHRLIEVPNKDDWFIKGYNKHDLEYGRFDNYRYTGGGLDYLQWKREEVEYYEAISHLNKLVEEHDPEEDLELEL